MKTAYLASHVEPLLKQLCHVTAQHGRLIVADGPPQRVHWALNIWPDVQTIPFTSISDAARKLRALGTLWAHLPNAETRRGELIAQQLPYFSPKPLPFKSPVPRAPLGSFTLLDRHTLLAAARCTSPFPHGEPLFVESPLPPSRAYLKLVEFFTLTGAWPEAGARCLELGASPGSWTWVLKELDTQITAIDRAPLAFSHPNITFLQKDAFSHTPDADWIFSDLICYPEKLLAWVEKWIHLEAHFVCTLKFQEGADYAIVKEFEKIPDSRAVHLFHNKHELTWSRLLPNKALFRHNQSSE